MKRVILLSLVAIVFFTSSCMTERKAEKEKKAIIAVIEGSTNAYKARDINRIDSLYLHDSFTTRLNAGKYGFAFRRGWEEITDAYREMFAANPMPITTKYEKQDYQIRLYRNCAWCVHDEVIYDSENEYQHHQIGVHFLEKVKGEWKIVYLSYIDSSSYEEAEENN